MLKELGIEANQRDWEAIYKSRFWLNSPVHGYQQRHTTPITDEKALHSEQSSRHTLAPAMY
jgi:hypothetical protein